MAKYQHSPAVQSLIDKSKANQSSARKNGRRFTHTKTHNPKVKLIIGGKVIYSGHDIGEHWVTVNGVHVLLKD